MKERQLSAVFLRLLIHIYVHQRCDVRWNNRFSTRFPVTNGCRQGAIMSGIFFCIYSDRLIKRLRQVGTGCWISGEFAGVFVYCDDVILLSASREGLQSLMTTCEKFANQNNLSFSTNIDPNKSKTKCIIFGKSTTNHDKIPNIILNGNPLPWVSKVTHVGNLLSNKADLVEDDCHAKRSKFVARNCSLNQEFASYPQMVKVHMNNVYNMSHTGRRGQTNL